MLGVEAVLGDGAIAQFGPVAHPAEFDLLGLLAGSEGTLGVITKLWVRLTPDPQDRRLTAAFFDSLDAAARAAVEIVTSGVAPSALELMDQNLVMVPIPKCGTAAPGCEISWHSRGRLCHKMLCHKICS